MLEVKNLKHKYVSGEVVTQALNDISITFPDTGMIFIVGRSGSGKTTLLNMIGGLNKPESGTIMLDDLNVTGFWEHSLNKYRNHFVGFIFQEYYLIENMTAFDNVLIALELCRKEKERAQIRSLFERLEISGLENRFIPELSGGQKQRVAIARALIKNPKFILADEPAGALDRKTGEELYKTLHALSKEKLVIIVSHDPEAANRYADRIIQLADGKIIEDQVRSVSGAKLQLDMRLKMGRLSLKRAFSFGVLGLFRYRLRLLLSMVMLILALSLMYLLLSYDFSNGYEKALNAMRAENTNYYFAETHKSNLEEIRVSYPELQYDRIIELEQTSMPYAEYSEYQYYGGHTIKGFKLMDEDIASKMEFRLLAGRFPTSKGEVVISEYFYSCFKDLSYRDFITYEMKSIEKPEDLLGVYLHELALRNGLDKLEIVGVMKTDTALDWYTSLKTSDNNELNTKFYNRMNQSVDNYLFVSKETIDQIEESENHYYILYVIGDMSDDLAVLEMLEENDIAIYGNTFWEVGSAARAFEYFDELLFAVTAAIVAFSSLLLIYYFFGSASDENKTSNILRLLGASRLDIVRIYFARSVIIAVVVGLANVLCGHLLVTYMNFLMRDNFYIFITLFSNSFTTSLLILAGCFAIAILSSVITVAVYIRKKPITIVAK